MHDKQQQPPAPGPGICVLTFRTKLGSGDWQREVESALSQLGLATAQRGSSFLAWTEAQAVPGTTGFRYADGWLLAKTWLGPRTHGISVFPRRTYFDAATGERLDEPEHRLVKKAPSYPSPRVRITECCSLGMDVAKCLPDTEAKPLVPQTILSNLQGHSSWCFGQGEAVVGSQQLGTLLKRLGVHRSSADFRVQIVTEASRSSQRRAYAEELASSFQQIGCHGNIRLAALEEYSELDVAASVTLVGVPGGKGDPIPDAIERLFERLESRRLPYRLFSVDNPSMSWSAFDQVGSLIQAAGGVPYRLRLPWPDHAARPLLVGVDLGHPEGSPTSWLSVAALDYSGVLLSAARAKQSRDETARLDTLTRLLTRVLHEATAAGQLADDVLVLRDGRLLAGESIETYRATLGDRLTFVEVRKGRAPILASATGDPVPPGTACLLVDTQTALISPVPATSRFHLPGVLKLNMASEWDGLEMGMASVLEIVCGLCYSPSLGLRPHRLPGPVYWADGVASVSKTNRQFAGQNFHEGD